MKQSRCSTTRIVTAIKKQEAGATVKDLCREMNISDAAFYKWEAKYGWQYRDF